MKQVEELLLCSLHWKLAMPTILDYVELYIQFLPFVDQRTAWVMRYFSELALQAPIHSLYLPSKIASCIVVLALYCLKEEEGANTVELWTREMEEFTGFTWQSLEGCLVTLTALLEDIRNTMPELSIIGRRYRKLARGSVAVINIPRVSSLAMLST
jgi:hypothetical protein